GPARLSRGPRRPARLLRLGGADGLRPGGARAVATPEADDDVRGHERRPPGRVLPLGPGAAGGDLAPDRTRRRGREGRPMSPTLAVASALLAASGAGASVVARMARAR